MGVYCPESTIFHRCQKLIRTECTFTLAFVVNFSTEVERVITNLVCPRLWVSFNTQDANDLPKDHLAAS